MTCSPKLLRSPRTSMTGLQPSGTTDGSSFLGTPSSIPPDIREEDCEDGVEHDHEEDRLNHRCRGAGSDLLAIPLDEHSLEAAGERDDEAEHRRLDEADPEVGDRSHFVEALDVGDRRDFEREPDEHAAADQRHQHRPERQQRHHHHRGDDARKDERFDRRHADGAHRVDFLGDLHRPDLRRERRARPAGDHDRGHQRAQLAHRDPADEVDGVDLRAELGELDRALLGDDDADEEAHQADNAERADADHVEALDHGIRPERLGRRMTLANAIKVAPKKPSRPTRVAPISVIHSPISLRTRGSPPVLRE